MEGNAQDNPYSTILNIIRADARENTSAPWRLGAVVSVSPLVVELAGIPLTGQDLLVNPLLLEHSRPIQAEVSGSLNGSTDCETCNMTNFAVTTGALGGFAHWGGALAPGDQVVLLQSQDGQQFVLLCKVVSP